MDNTSTDTQKCYHSTLHLLGAHDQAPPSFWDQKEVLEVPSSRSSPTQRRTFARCGSLQVKLDRESRDLRQREKQRKEKHQDVRWWSEYEIPLSQAIEGLNDVLDDLRIAARLHNYVLQYRGGVDREGRLEELDPIWINSEDHQSPGGRILNLAVLKEELKVALAGVKPYQWNLVSAKIPVDQDSNVTALHNVLSLPMLATQGGPLKRYSALVSENFRNHVPLVDEEVAKSVKSPIELQELLQTYFPEKPQDTPGLTVSQELALAVMKKLERDNARIGGDAVFSLSDGGE